MRLGDLRLKIAADLALQVLDRLSPEVAHTPGHPASLPRHSTRHGWQLKHEFIGPPAYPEWNIPGADRYGTSWPNITKPTNYAYNYALAGWQGQWYVPEFFLPPEPSDFSVWWGQIEHAQGHNYWRVWALETWVRTWAQPGHYPPRLSWLPAQAPTYFRPFNFPRQEPNWFRKAAKLPHVDPHGEPLRGPAPGWITRPGQQPLPTGENHPTPHPQPLPSRPPRGTKEVKATATGMAGAVRLGFRVIEGITEAKDFVNALFEGMPPHVQAMAAKHGDGYVGMAAKIELIYRYWPQWDPVKGLAAIAYNQLEDKIVGRIHGAVAKATKHLNITRGPALGGFR